MTFVRACVKNRQNETCARQAKEQANSSRTLRRTLPGCLQSRLILGCAGRWIVELELNGSKSLPGVPPPTNPLDGE